MLQTSLCPAAESSVDQQPGLINSARLLLIELLCWQTKLDSQDITVTISNRIDENRSILARMFRRSPTLRWMLGRIIETLYLEAREHVCEARGIPLNHFPEQCPYALDEILSPHFLPAALSVH